MTSKNDQIFLISVLSEFIDFVDKDEKLSDLVMNIIDYILIRSENYQFSIEEIDSELFTDSIKALFPKIKIFEKNQDVLAPNFFLDYHMFVQGISLYLEFIKIEDIEILDENGQLTLHIFNNRHLKEIIESVSQNQILQLHNEFFFYQKMALFNAYNFMKMLNIPIHFIY